MFQSLSVLTRDKRCVVWYLLCGVQGVVGEESIVLLHHLSILIMSVGRRTQLRLCTGLDWYWLNYITERERESLHTAITASTGQTVVLLRLGNISSCLGCSGPPRLSLVLAGLSPLLSTQNKLTKSLQQSWKCRPRSFFCWRALCWVLAILSMREDWWIIFANIDHYKHIIQTV